MEDLMARLEELLQKSASACCTSQPGGTDSAYQFGRLQGRYSGIKDAINTVQQMIDEFEEDEDDEEES